MASSPRTSISTTQKIRSIGREARVNELISERLDHWKAAMRERGAHTLRALDCCRVCSPLSLNPRSPRLESLPLWRLCNWFLTDAHVRCHH